MAERYRKSILNGKNNQESLDGTCIYFYNNRVYEKNKDKDQ